MLLLEAGDGGFDVGYLLLALAAGSGGSLLSGVSTPCVSVASLVVFVGFRSRRALQLLEIVDFLGAEEVVDAAEVLAHLAAAELIDLADQPVEEVAVVADEYDSAVEIAQGCLEDVLGLHVEVVGRLVENEEVARLQ